MREDLSTPLIGEIHDVVLGENVVIRPFCNLYGCMIGNDTKVGAFVEIQKGVVVGARCKIQDGVSICTGTVIHDEVFIGPHVVFTNDADPRACNPDGSMKHPDDWECRATHVGRGARIGANATVGPGLTIGEGAFITAGALVTRDVPAGAKVVAAPSRVITSNGWLEPLPPVTP